MTPKKYFGKYVVSSTASAITQAWALCGAKALEYWKLREHALKLAYWPDASEEAEVDLDWGWIRGLEHLHIGELRIDETINGKENIRIIFFKVKHVLEGESLPRIWLLSVFAKKRQDFGNAHLSAFKGMRTIIVDRKYGGLPT